MAQLPVGALQSSDLLRQPTFPEGPHRWELPTLAWIGGPVGVIAAVLFIGISLWMLATLATPGRRLAMPPPPPLKPTELATRPSGGSDQFDHLPARPRPPLPVVKVAAVGDTLQTPAGQRRRVALPDGSVLYVNQNTTVSVQSDRELRVESGEIFLEQKPSASGL